MEDWEVFGNLGVREAVRLLREYDVTPEQYATVELAEEWRVSGTTYPDREAAFTAAREEANRTGEWAEVWCVYLPSDCAESWIVKPDGTGQ